MKKTNKFMNIVSFSILNFIIVSTSVFAVQNSPFIGTEIYLDKYK